MVNEHEGAVSWRKSLRNDAINYRAGWWAVTIQVEKNKSIFGAVVGEKVVLNALGAAEFSAWQKYIQKNPANWLRDRYGACTAYSWGNIDLLNCKRVAFVASQGFFASDLRARKVWARGSKGATKVDPSDNKVAAADSKVAADKEVAQIDKVLISTFTSAQEREALRRALLKKRPLIAVFPGGIPCKKEMLPEFVAAFTRDGHSRFHLSHLIQGLIRRLRLGAMSMFCVMPMKFGWVVSRPMGCSRRCWLGLGLEPHFEALKISERVALATHQPLPSWGEIWYNIAKC